MVIDLPTHFLIDRIYNNNILIDTINTINGGTLVPPFLFYYELDLIIRIL